MTLENMKNSTTKQKYVVYKVYLVIYKVNGTFLVISSCFNLFRITCFCCFTEQYGFLSFENINFNCLEKFIFTDVKMASRGCISLLTANSIELPVLENIKLFVCDV